MKKNPIGIFDSGVGGLTVAKAIKELMPNERIIYYGDTLHLPYGDKSALALKFYAQEISRFLISHGAKAIIVACNTASAVAYSSVLKTVNKKALVLNVIDPCVAYLQQNNALDIGVIGTKTTISSGVYEKRIAKVLPKAKVNSLATPLLAPMIEEGFTEGVITREVIQHYLAQNNLAESKHLVLGCTHYPLIETYFQQALPKASVVNSAVLVAKSLKLALEEKDIAAQNLPTIKDRFLVSDYTLFFEKQAKQFFGHDIQLKKENIWNQYHA